MKVVLRTHCPHCREYFDLSLLTQYWIKPTMEQETTNQNEMKMKYACKFCDKGYLYKKALVKHVANCPNRNY